MQGSFTITCIVCPLPVTSSNNMTSPCASVRVSPSDTLTSALLATMTKIRRMVWGGVPVSEESGRLDSEHSIGCCKSFGALIGAVCHGVRVQVDVFKTGHTVVAFVNAYGFHGCLADAAFTLRLAAFNAPSTDLGCDAERHRMVLRCLAHRWRSRRTFQASSGVRPASAKRTIV
jgi:hypothetical protein